jgi:hypothetical protein
MLLAKKCHVRASRSHAAASCTTVAVPRQHVVSRRQLVAVASSAGEATWDTLETSPLLHTVLFYVPPAPAHSEGIMRRSK